MNKIVITEIRLAARLFQSGILRYFNNQELTLYMTDFCYNAKVQSINNDRAHVKMLIEQGLLQIVSLDEEQMARMESLYHKYKPKFRIKTISALVIANDFGFNLLSEDDLLRETAKQDFKLNTMDKESLIANMIYEITSMGISVDVNVLKKIL